jgi:hypothetical protein
MINTDIKQLIHRGACNNSVSFWKGHERVAPMPVYRVKRCAAGKAV